MKNFAMILFWGMVFLLCAALVGGAFWMFVQFMAAIFVQTT